MSSTPFSYSNIAFLSHHMHPLTSTNHSLLHTNSTTPLPFPFHLSRSPPSLVLHLTCHVPALSPRVSFSHLVQGRSIQHIFTVSHTPYMPLKHPPSFPLSLSLYLSLTLFTYLPKSRPASLPPTGSNIHSLFPSLHLHIWKAAVSPKGVHVKAKAGWGP